jgi:phosphonate transport system substrate-binding protein
VNPARRALIICLGFLLLWGCGGSEAPEPDPAPSHEALIIGLIPEQNLFRQLERYRPLIAYLSDRTGVDIDTRLLPRYGNIVDNFMFAELDGAFFGSFTYALAHARLGVSVIARPVNLDGRSTYHGLIFVRTGSGIETIAEMRGKRFVFVDKATTAGYLLPLDYFFTNGVDDYETYLGETYFSGTHEDAFYDVVNGKADIGAAKNTVFDRLAIVDQNLLTDLTILARSPDVPENGLALRDDLDPSIRGRLKEAILSMHTDPEGQEVLRQFAAIRFIETTDQDYEPVFRYAREIGLDLSSYDYQNE